MKYTGFILVAFGITNIIFPDIIAYLIGGFCVVTGIGMILGSSFGPKKPNGENYVKFGNYKIYR